MTSRQGHGAPNPTWIPVANEAVRRIAAKVGGTPGGNIGEPFGMPLTAHFIGGCAIGDSSETGVIDPYQRVYGHPGLHVADGAAVTANLGVNPSLTITAQAERAMAFWPNKGEADPRPALGERVRAPPAGRPSVARPYPPPPPARSGSPSSASAERRVCAGQVPPGYQWSRPGLPARPKWAFYTRNPPVGGSLSRAEPGLLAPSLGPVSVSRRRPTERVDDQGPATLPPRPGPGAFPARPLS